MLALGPSSDGTDAIARELADADERNVPVANPAADIPVGLNLAIRREPVSDDRCGRCAFRASPDTLVAP